MRVTRIVREYIEEQVRLKVKPKYEEELERERYHKQVLDEACQNCFEAAKKAFGEAIDKAVKEYDFLADERDGDEVRLSWYVQRGLALKCPNSESAYFRMEREIKEKVYNIIINLELGGTKADLDRMLAELDG